MAVLKTAKIFYHSEVNHSDVFFADQQLFLVGLAKIFDEVFKLKCRVKLGSCIPLEKVEIEEVIKALGKFAFLERRLCKL